MKHAPAARHKQGWSLTYDESSEFQIRFARWQCLAFVLSCASITHWAAETAGSQGLNSGSRPETMLALHIELVLLAWRTVNETVHRHVSASIPLVHETEIYAL